MIQQISKVLKNRASISSLEILSFSFSDAIVQVDGEGADSIEDILHARRVKLYPGLPKQLDVVGDGVRLGVVQ